MRLDRFEKTLIGESGICRYILQEADLVIVSVFPWVGRELLAELMGCRMASLHGRVLCNGPSSHLLFSVGS